MAGAADPVEPLARALWAGAPIVAGITEAQWSLPTPCSDWQVRELLNHLVGGNLLFIDSLVDGAGRTPEEMVARVSADHLGTDPLAAYEESATSLLAAFRAPGALDRPMTVPFGSVPGAVAVQLRLVEVLVHGWDLATATGQPAEFDAADVAAAVAFTEATLPRIPAGRRPFGPSRPAPTGGSPLDRLVALTGRSPAGLGVAGEASGGSAPSR